MGVRRKINPNFKYVCLFGKGEVTADGMALIQFPHGRIAYRFNAFIVDADIQMLLSLRDMEQLGFFFNIQRNELIQSDSGAVKRS